MNSQPQGPTLPGLATRQASVSGVSQPGSRSPLAVGGCCNPGTPWPTTHPLPSCPIPAAAGLGGGRSSGGIWSCTREVGRSSAVCTDPGQGQDLGKGSVLPWPLLTLAQGVLCGVRAEARLSAPFTVRIH